MKKTNLIIAIFCVVLCLLGWVMMINDSSSQLDEYSEHVTLADHYMKEGLYQRAILDYMAAFDSKNSEEIAEKIAKAYELRYSEDPEGTFSALTSDLGKLLEIYPANEKITIQLAQIYKEDNNYRDAFFWLNNAFQNGAKSAKLTEMLREARYAHDIYTYDFQKVKPAVGDTYVVCRNKLWGLHNVDGRTAWDCEYAFISQANKDGVVLVTMEKDSRLINGDGMVLGIFKEKVVDSGIYSEGLIAASTGGSYAYYDEFAKKQFGDYEAAGAFVDGRAAVKKGGKWCLVDTKGKTCSKEFAHIVLNVNGEHITNGVILAASEDGQYKIYDKNLKEKASLGKFEAVDIVTEDGIIAVCQDGKWGFVNTSGEMIIKPAYEEARSFSNGLAAVCVDGKWGYIDRNNTVVIGCTFLAADYFNENGSAMVCTDQKKVVVEREDIPLEPDTDEIEDSPEDTAEDSGSDEDVPVSYDVVEPYPDETESDSGMSNPDPDETGSDTDEDGSSTVTNPTIIDYEIQDSWNLIVLYNGIVED